MEKAAFPSVKVLTKKPVAGAPPVSLFFEFPDQESDPPHDSRHNQQKNEVSHASEDIENKRKSQQHPVAPLNCPRAPVNQQEQRQKQAQKDHA